MKATTVQNQSSFDSELVSAFFRRGEYREAKSYLRDLGKGASEDGQLIFIANNLALIEHFEGNYSEALRILVQVLPLAEKCSDPLLRAKFHLNYGNALERIASLEGVESYFDRALPEYDGAAYFFREAGHRDEWCALNNAAFLLIHFKRWPEVHSYLDRAAAVFSKRDDEDKPARLAEINDTRAQAKLAEGLIEDAVYYASVAVQILVHAGEPRTYIQAKRTLEQALEAQEKALTVWALKEAEGSVPGAAKILLMSRQGLRRRIIADDELMKLAEFCEPRGASKR